MLHLDLVRVGSGKFEEICNPNFLFRVRVRVRLSLRHGVAGIGVLLWRYGLGGFQCWSV